MRTRVALLVLGVIAACAPGTTRPSFLPYPEAVMVILAGPPERVTPQVSAWLAGEGLKIEWMSVQDGYVETAWFNTRTHESTMGMGDVGDLEGNVKVRCWMDPDAPGKTRFTTEVVYRPLLDPSRQERDLEVAVPAGSDGARLVERLREAMKTKFGG
jgi:hypothetical protein